MKQCFFDGCKNDSFSHNFCKRHQNQRTDDKWLNKHQNRAVEPRSPIRRYKLPTTNEQGIKTTKKELVFSFDYKNQLDMFKDIWNERPHICALSGQDLDKVSKDRIHWCMAHILAKGKYTYFKYKKDNVLLLHPDVHFMVDNFTEDLREKHPEVNFDLWFSEVEEMKQRYKEFLLYNLL